MKVLTHNVATVREAVFTNAADNLDVLFGFSASEPEKSTTLDSLDDLHSNLLAVVVQKFLNTHSWYMADYFANKEAFRQSPEMLLNSNGLLQTLVDTNYCYSGSAMGQWMEDIELVHVLVDTFSGQRGEQAIICAADVLCNIIRSISPLLQQLETETLITQMLKSAFDAQVSPSFLSPKIHLKLILISPPLPPQNPCSDVAQDKAIAVCHALADKYSNDGRILVSSFLSTLVPSLISPPGPEKIPESLGPVTQYVSSFDNVLTGISGSEVCKSVILFLFRECTNQSWLLISCRPNLPIPRDA